MWNASLMQQGNFIDIFLAQHVSGTYVHVRCGWCRATGSHSTIRAAHTTYAAARNTTTRPKIRCTKPHAATQHVTLLMMCVRTRNMSS